MPADGDDATDNPAPQSTGADRPDESASSERQASGGTRRATVESSARSYSAENPSEGTEEGVASAGTRDAMAEPSARSYSAENPSEGADEGVASAGTRKAMAESSARSYPAENPSGGAEEREAAIRRRAGDLRDEAARAEREVTPDVEEVVRSTHGYRAGEEWALKSESSLVSKVIGDMRKEGLSLDVASAGLHDTLRYTIVYPPDRYTGSTQEAIRLLEARGHEAQNVKNCWQEGSPYKGINAAFVSPTGRSFELQFHTPESWDTKQATHHDYNVAKDPDADPDQRRSANERSIAASAELETPPGVHRIGSSHAYRRL